MYVYINKIYVYKII